MTNKIIEMQARLENCIQVAKSLNDGIPLSEQERIEVTQLRTSLKEMEDLIVQKLRENKRLKKQARLA